MRDNILNSIFAKHKKLLFESIGILNEAMTHQEAMHIFHKFGYPNAHRSAHELYSARRNLVMKHHPDKGGNTKDMQDINAAFDVLYVELKRKGNTSSPDSSNPVRSSIYNYIFNRQNRFFEISDIEIYVKLLTEILKYYTEVDLEHANVYEMESVERVLDSLKHRCIDYDPYSIDDIEVNNIEKEIRFQFFVGVAYSLVRSLCFKDRELFRYLEKHVVI